MVGELGEFKSNKEKVVSQVEEGKLRKMKSIEGFGDSNQSNVLKGDRKVMLKQYEKNAASNDVKEERRKQFEQAVQENELALRVI